MWYIEYFKIDFEKFVKKKVMREMEENLDKDALCVLQSNADNL